MPSMPVLDPALTYACWSVMLPTPPPKFSFGDSVSKRSNGALGSPSEVPNGAVAMVIPFFAAGDVISIPPRPKYSFVLNTDSRSPLITPPLNSAWADMMSAKVSSAAELRRLEGAGDSDARFLTGRNHAGDGRPAESGTRGESTGMLQTDLLAMRSRSVSTTYLCRTRQ